MTDTHPNLAVAVGADIVRSQAAEIERLKADLVPLQKLAWWIMTEFDGGDIDGGALQDKAVSLGLFVENTATSENAKEWEHLDFTDEGDTFFSPSEILRRAQEAGNE